MVMIKIRKFPKSHYKNRSINGCIAENLTNKPFHIGNSKDGVHSRNIYRRIADKIGWDKYDIINKYSYKRVLPSKYSSYLTSKYFTLFCRLKYRKNEKNI